MKKAAILIGMIFIAIAVANADFGQSSGALDFGEIHTGQNKTLMYWLINTGDEDLNFKMVLDSDNIAVEPMNGTIRPHGQQEIKVTALGNKIGNFSGKISAVAAQNLSGMIVFNVELEKNYRFAIVETGKFLPVLLLIGGIAIFLMFFSVYYCKLKGGKKKWKFGK